MPPTLTYCTNLFPSETLADVTSALQRFGVPLRARRRLETLPLGLHLPARATQDLAAPGALPEFADRCRQWGISVVTLNAFPFGGFHGAVVKEAVFRPTWEEPSRREYTLSACTILAHLLPRGATGSVSTHTGTFKEFGVSPEGDDRIARAWLRMSLDLARLEEESGRRIVLSVEPEPLSRLETVAELIPFFERMWSGPLRTAALEWSVHRGWLESASRRYLGVCFDVCHQAVEFEPIAESIARLRAAGIPIGKIQASVAPSLRGPSSSPEGLARLRAFAEPRYLHQTFGRKASGQVVARRDLADALDDGAFLREVKEIRTHFHLPIFLERSGPLETTRGELASALAIAGDATDCVEVETYTLGALPEPPADDAAVIETMARELEYAETALRSTR